MYQPTVWKDIPMSPVQHHYNWLFAATCCGCLIISFGFWWFVFTMLAKAVR